MATTLLSRSLDYVERYADRDGVWRTPYKAGPVQEVTTSLGLHYLGLHDDQFLQQERGIYSRLIQEQNPDGSFSPNTNLPASTGVTRLMLAGLTRTLHDDPNMDRETRQRLESAASKASQYARTHPKSAGDNLVMNQVTDLVANLASPEPVRKSSLLAPYSLGKAHALLFSRLGQKVAGQMAAPVGGLLPALAILANQQEGPKPATSRREHKLDHMEKALQDKQDKNGSWLLITMGTSLSLMALKARGHSVDEPEMQKGVNFILKDRVEDEQRWCNSEMWDSCVAADLLLSKGVRADDARIAPLLQLTLSEQAEDGRWAFAKGSQKIVDSDSASIPMRFLTHAYATAEPSQQPAVRAAVQKCADFYLQHQQGDGGWNAWDQNHTRWGSRVPGGTESMALDPATPDVTGRILWALAAADKNGLLRGDQKPRFQDSLRNATHYLQDSQNKNGSWWARWVAGYTASPAFVLTALRTSGCDMNQDWIQKSRQFFLNHQNPDGGWGEPVGADKDAKLAGRGPSTPVQTAFAITSLLASSPLEDISQDPVLRKAVDYLTKSQEDGTWNNHQPLYTIAPNIEYYDAPFMTHCMVSMALKFYEKACQEGVSRAF